MSNILPRIKPNPLPPINAVPEYLADDELKRVYEDAKSTLQVPWMGVVTMAFAHYPTFFETLWSGLRELLISREFVEACRDLRGFVEESAAQLEPQSMLQPLKDKGYADREIEEILELNEVFSHGNMPYLMIATAARLLLEGHDLNEETSSVPFEGRHGPTSAKGLLLMESHHVDTATASVYQSIKSTLGLPFVNTDYRAFARWPSYFALAWDDLSATVTTETYEARVTSVHNFAVDRVLSVPNPKGLNPETLRNAARADNALEEIIEVVRLFQWLLPGLVMNVAYFRAQLIKQS